MPQIGETIQRKGLGLEHDKNRTMIWGQCPNCKTERWIRRDNKYSTYKLCKSCSSKIAVQEGRIKNTREGNVR
jgi:DNA-directed RNA polymerase subunit RPC12/RpoP